MESDRERRLKELEFDRAVAAARAKVNGQIMLARKQCDARRQEVADLLAKRGLVMGNVYDEP